MKNNVVRTALVLVCLGLAGCATAQPQVQLPLPPENIPVVQPLKVGPDVTAQPAALPVNLQAYQANTIVVDTKQFTLYFIDPNRQVFAYGIGVGKEGFEWYGEGYSINDKQMFPAWNPPKEMIEREREKCKTTPAQCKIIPTHVAGGASNNPLGHRALYIFKDTENKPTLYRIHGTNQPWTIGQAMSSGCIRLKNVDIIDLYNRVEKGTRVVVL